MVIDSHTHAYDASVIADPVGWAKARGETHWLELIAPQERKSLQGWVSRERMLADMDAAGVDHAVLLGWYWEHPQTCQEHNRCYADWIAAEPERFSAFASVNALEGAAALDTLKRAHDAGFVGVGEMHPWVQGFAMRDPAWLRVVEYAATHAMPINFHVSEPLGRPHAARVPTPFEDFLWLAQEYPELKIILSHWGGLIAFYEWNPFVKNSLKNVLYDTAASPLLYDDRMFKSVVDAVGADKVLYGSDYPLRVYPKIQDQPDFSTFLKSFQNSDLTDEQRTKILGGTMANLILKP